MKVRGSYTFDAPRAVVFASICDPDALLGIIPGCTRIERVGDDEYRGQISLRLPGVVGTYRTVVRLVDADPPGHGHLEGELEGSLGTIKGRATFRLTDDRGRTTLDYEGQAEIGGPLARLDARFAEGVAGSLVKQGLRNLNGRLGDRSSARPAMDDRQPDREVRA